jgi:hypothetical protein
MLYYKDNQEIHLNNRGEHVMTNQYINQAGSDALPKLSAPTLNSSAMLVEVNISKWEGKYPQC